MTDCTRAWLAVLALLAVVAFGVLVILMGASLNTTQIAILTSIVTLVGKDVGTAFAYFFDGTPKPETPKDPA
jgi:hypothetical protein